MTPNQRRELSLTIIARCQAASIARGNGVPTDRELADKAGVDDTQFSHIKHGRRELKLSELVALANVYGAEATLDVLAGTVAPTAAPVKLHVVGEALDLSVVASSLAQAAHKAEASNGADRDEARGLVTMLRVIIAQATRLEAFYARIAA